MLSCKHATSYCEIATVLFAFREGVPLPASTPPAIAKPPVKNQAGDLVIFIAWHDAPG